MKWDELSPEERDALVAEKVMDWQEHLCDSQLVEIEGSWECGRCGLSGDWTEESFATYIDHIALSPRYTGWQVRDRMIAIGYFVPFRYQVGKVCSDCSFHTVMKELDDDKIKLAALLALGIAIE